MLLALAVDLEDFIFVYFLVVDLELALSLYFCGSFLDRVWSG